MQEAQNLLLRKQIGGGSKWKTQAVLVFLLVGMLLGLYFRVRDEFSAAHRPYAFAAIFIVVCGVMFWKRRTRSKRSGTTRVEASEKEVTILGEDSKTTVPWSSFGECLESPGLFVLLDRPKGVLFVLPKRAFPDENWQNWFRALANHRPEPTPMESPALPQSAAGDQITINFQLGFRDYVDRTLASWRTWGILLAVMGMVVGISIYSALNPPPNAVNSGTKVFFMFVLPFMVVIGGMMVLIISFGAWRAHTKYLIPQQMILSANSIHIASRDGTNTLPWTTYSCYKETRRSFILWNSRDAYWLLLPKRFFGSPQDQDVCRALLGSHLRRTRWFFG